MLQTHIRENQAEVRPPVSQASPMDLPGTTVPRIGVRLSKAKLVAYLRNKLAFHTFTDDSALFKATCNFINYNLQKEYPLYFLTVTGGETNSIVIKNAFHLLDDSQMNQNDSDDSSSKSLYKELHKEVSEVLNKIIQNLVSSTSVLSNFINRTANNEGWSQFVEVRERGVEFNQIQEALEELNGELKMYFLDSEFLSLDRYNSTIPAIYFYDCQCRIICMFSLQTDRGTIESIVKTCAAISCDGEAHGQLFYSENAVIGSENGLPVPNEVSEQYVRTAYKNEINQWVNQVRDELSSINAAQNFLLIEIQEIVVNRFYNGFVVGHFLSNERAFNASRMAVSPPKVSFK